MCSLWLDHIILLPGDTAQASSCMKTVGGGRAQVTTPELHSGTISANMGELML